VGLLECHQRDEGETMSVRCTSQAAASTPQVMKSYHSGTLPIAGSHEAKPATRIHCTTMA